MPGGDHPREQRVVAVALAVTSDDAANRRRRRVVGDRTGVQEAREMSRPIVGDERSMRRGDRSKWSGQHMLHVAVFEAMHATKDDTQTVVPSEAFETEQRAVRGETGNRARRCAPDRREIVEPEVRDVAVDRHDGKIETRRFDRDRLTAAEARVAHDSCQSMSRERRDISSGGHARGLGDGKSNWNDRRGKSGLYELSPTRHARSL